MSKSINGYNYNGWGLTYKVYLPKDPRYSRKDRPTKHLLVTEAFVDPLQNTYHYCFYTHLDEDGVTRFDYDGYTVEDSNSFYNLLVTTLGRNGTLNHTQQQRYQHAGMVTIDGAFTYKIPNCLVETVVDKPVDPGATEDDPLEKMENSV